MLKGFLFSIFFVCNVHSFSATISSIKKLKADQAFITLPGTDKILTLAGFIQLKPSEFKKITGHKLTLKEMIVFKITQKRIKKTIRKDGTIDMPAFTKQPKEPFKWNWGGFFLGLLLPVLGLIITAFFKDDQRKNRITSAAIGTSIACIIFLIFVVSSF